MAVPRCPGHARHWFAPAAYVRAPFCVRRCGTPNPRPLTADEWDEYNDYMSMVGAKPEFIHTREEYEQVIRDQVEPTVEARVELRAHDGSSVETRRAAGAKELRRTGMVRKGRNSGTGHAGYGKGKA